MSEEEDKAKAEAEVEAKKAAEEAKAAKTEEAKARKAAKAKKAAKKEANLAKGQTDTVTAALVGLYAKANLPPDIMKSLAAAANTKASGGQSELLTQIQTMMREKAATRYETIQVIHESLGTTNDVSRNLTKIHEEIYDESFVGKGRVGGMKNTLRAYFEDANDLMNSFFGIIDGNNMLVTHYANNASKEQMATTVLLGRAMKLSSDHQQAFLDRQFAQTGKVDNSLMISTLAHAKAIEEKTKISSKIIVENTAVMMSEISKFGAMTQGEMEKAAATVAKLGIKMSSFSGMVGGFNSFESAAQNVSKLTQALGVQVNVMDAVAMANNDPQALLGMFKEQFDVAGIDVYSLSQPMKRALADIFNLSDTSEVEKMFGAASDGLDDFLGKTDDAIASVGREELDKALATAESDIRRIDLLKEGVKTTTEQALKFATEQLTDGMSAIELKAKQHAEEGLLKVTETAAKGMQKKIVKESISGTKKVVASSIDAMITIADKQLTEWFESNWLEKIIEKGRKATPEEQQKIKADAAQATKDAAMAEQMNVVLHDQITNATKDANQEAKTRADAAAAAVPSGPGGSAPTLPGATAPLATSPAASVPPQPPPPKSVESTENPGTKVTITHTQSETIRKLRESSLFTQKDTTGAAAAINNQMVMPVQSEQSFVAVAEQLREFDFDVLKEGTQGMTDKAMEHFMAEYTKAVAKADANPDDEFRREDIKVVVTVADDGRLIASVKNE
jgi:hypothetical protein